MRTSSTSRLVAGAAADLAGHEHVGQKDHLDLHVAGAVAGLAAAAGQVEGEGGGGVLPLPRERLGGKELADLVERLDVGDRIGAGRAPDGRLIHQEHVLEQLPPGERPHLPTGSPRWLLAECSPWSRASRLRYITSWSSVLLPEPDDAGDRGERAQRDVRVHVRAGCAAWRRGS